MRVKRFAVPSALLILLVGTTLSATRVSADQPQENKVANRSNAVGGGGGNPFEFAIPDGSKIYEIVVRCGDEIDGFEVKWKKDDSTTGSFVVGSMTDGGQTQTPFTIPDTQRLVGCSGRVGDRLDRICWILSDNERSPVYGGNGGNTDFALFNDTKALCDLPSIIGFFGRCDKGVDKNGTVSK